MKQYAITGLLAGLLTVVVFTGCENNTAALAQTDEEQVEQLVVAEEEEYLYDVGIDDYEEDRMYDGYSSFDNPGKAPISNVLRFGRRVSERPRRVVRTVERVGPDSIKVSVAREFSGLFYIFAAADSNDTQRRTRYTKRLRHIVRRNALYVKRESDEVNDRQWKLAGISLGQGNSTPEASIRIRQIAITSSGGDTLRITDPLNTLLNTRDDIPAFAPGDLVTVRVLLVNNTANPVVDSTGATETVLLHFGVNREHHARTRLQFQGVDPVTGFHEYAGSWTIRQRPFRLYHAIFDAIDNGTIYDDDATTYPYNSTTWSTPYIVTSGD